MSTFRPMDFVKALADSLGLGHLPIRKIVVEAAYDEEARVYVVSLVGEQQARQVTDLIRIVPVADVQVADDCTVKVVQ